MAAKLTVDDELSSKIVSRHLVFADVALQYELGPADDAPVLVVELAPDEGLEMRAIEYLGRADTIVRAASVLDATGKVSALPSPEEPLVTWAGTRLDETFTDHLRAALTVPGQASGSASTDKWYEALGPFMLLRTHAGEQSPYTEVLICTRIRSIGALFVRVAQFAHSADASVAQLVNAAFDRRAHLEDFVRVEGSVHLREGNVHLRYEKDVEIEEKITVVGDASIWHLTKSMWAAVENGHFPGFITNPGYELTRWHFVQSNFEVTAPDNEVGHYAFQRVADDQYLLKMKQFSKDSLRRVETFRGGLQIPDADFDGYLAREFPNLTFRRLPDFRRTRFDINVQSVVTGHCFGIETDEVTLSDASGRKLRQVETEYLETRRHDGMDGTTIDAELSRLTGLVEEHLAGLRIAAKRDFYSKLSFLRDSAPTADR
ncbi:hypothetical protein [Streptomyces sp. SID5606]|uniref:hypothetical protein n=1 Tax=Streptomyces sp. SID5606 TaxID=2690305 RepID=UPI00136AAF45|nr:hypothetical protein [Streptomyces sp. SID5606]MZD56779.1 hypothetical protein [Streptomyces sp. SID5606]